MNGRSFLIGYSKEATFAHLLNVAESRNLQFNVFDLNKLDTCSDFSAEIYDDGLRIAVDSEVTEINSPLSIFYRGFYRPSVDRKNSDMIRSALELIEISLDKLPAASLVLNRPFAGASNASKYIHGMQLSESGLLIPETIISNDPDEIEKLVTPDGGWVSKGCSGVRTMVEYVSPSDLSSRSKLKISPTLFQKRILGFDVRAHFVRKKCIALKIETTAIDYRYAKKLGHKLKVSRCELPGEVYYACIEYMMRSGLDFAGFDFKVDEHGCFWALESNPMPGFAFFDDFAENAIALEICSALASGATPWGRPMSAEPLDAVVESRRRPSLDRGV